jgi:hypothetical protein
MTTHELARKLLEFPDVPVTTCGMGDSRFVVKKVVSVIATSEDGWSFYEAQPSDDGAQQIVRLW